MKPPFPVTLIPVNRLDRAKGRLADLLAPHERAVLARITLDTVLQAVHAVGGHPVVLTADPAVERHVRGHAEILRESPLLHGLNAQLEHAREALACESLLVLHADLPLAGAADLEALAAGMSPAPAALAVPSADGGTNAMLLDPPGLVPFHYGPGSLEAHRHAANAVGVDLQTLPGSQLAIDLDTPEDIAALLQHEPGRSSPAGRQLIDWAVESRFQSSPQ